MHCDLSFTFFPVLSGDLFSADLNPRWKRPNAPTLDPSTDTLVFQQIDLDYYLGERYRLGFMEQYLMYYNKICCSGD